MIITFCIANSSFLCFPLSYIKSFLLCFDCIVHRILSKFHLAQSKYNGSFIFALIDLLLLFKPCSKSWHKLAQESYTSKLLGWSC